MHKVIAISCFLWTLTSYSQTVLNGTVRDEDGEPVEMVIVSALNPADSTIVSYASSNEHGEYSLSFNYDNLKKLLLRITGFNVKKDFKTVENRSQRVDWICQEENILLKEIAVKAQKLWGSKDTLNYLVVAYTRDHDVTIGDVIKRLPGIDIKDDGSIHYQGIPISNFYIENMDALQGRYNIATKGIKAEDVASVQVLEHHQHIKALEDQMPPEAAALNLKLKKEKNGVWTKSADIGLGYSDHLLWHTTARAMMFGKGEQHIMVYDTKNDGHGSDLLTSHYGGSGISGQVITSVSSPSSSPFGNNHRTNYHQFAANNLWKINDSTEMHVDASYKYDFTRTKTDVQTTYILPDGNERMLVENLATNSTQHQADVKLSYERNVKTNYLSNKFCLVGHWSDANNANNSTAIKEVGNHRTLGVSDNVHWVHRTERGGGFEFESSNAFSSTPQSLTVSPGVFQELLADGEAYSSVTQSATINSFNSANSFSLLNDIRRHRFTFAPIAHANIEYVGMESQLRAVNNMEGDMTYTHFDLGLGLSARYTLRQFQAQLGLPVSFQPTILGGNNHSVDSRSHLYFNPSASFSWRVNDHWATNGSVGWSSTPSSMLNLYTAYILRNYSNLTRYQGDIFDTESFGGRVKLDYKHIFKQFFGWIEFNCNQSSADMTYGSYINEQGYSEMQMVKEPHTSRSIQLRTNLRKDFVWKELSIEATGTYARGNSQYLRQDILTRYNSTRYAAEGKLNMKPCKWFDFGFTTQWSCYKSRTEGGISSRQSINWRNLLTLNTTIIDQHMWLTINATHVYNNLLDKRNNEYLSAQLRYRTKKMDFRLSADNLLNMRQYSTLSISDMTERYTVYHLQPFSVILSTSIYFK